MTVSLHPLDHEAEYTPPSRRQVLCRPHNCHYRRTLKPYHLYQTVHDILDIQVEEMCVLFRRRDTQPGEQLRELPLLWPSDIHTLHNSDIQLQH